MHVHFTFKQWCVRAAITTWITQYERHKTLVLVSDCFFKGSPHPLHLFSWMLFYYHETPWYWFLFNHLMIPHINLVGSWTPMLGNPQHRILFSLVSFKNCQNPNVFVFPSQTTLFGGFSSSNTSKGKVEACSNKFKAAPMSSADAVF